MARPIKPSKFPRAEVKRANERLRKLETVNRMAQSSEAYKSVERFALDPASPSSKFYRTTYNKDGSPAIRFITPAQYANLSRYDQLKFDEVVRNFLEDKTTTKIGIENVRRENYKSFMENHPDLKWTQEEYENFWSTYEQAQKDKEDITAYGVLNQIFNTTTKFSGDLTADKIDSLLHYNLPTSYAHAPRRTIMLSRARRRLQRESGDFRRDQ